MMNKLATLLIVLLFVGAGYMTFKSSQTVPAIPEIRSRDSNNSNTTAQGVETRQSEVGSGSGVDSNKVDSNKEGGRAEADAELIGLNEQLNKQQLQIKSTVAEILSLDQALFPITAANNGDIESSLIVLKAGVATLLSRIEQLTRESGKEAALTEQISALKAENANLLVEPVLLKKRWDQQLSVIQAGFEKEKAQYEAAMENLRMTADESKKQIDFADQLLQQKDLAVQAERQKSQQLGDVLQTLEQSMVTQLGEKDQALAVERQKSQQLRDDLKTLEQGMATQLGEKDQALAVERQKSQQLRDDLQMLKQGMAAERGEKDQALAAEQQISQQLRQDMLTLKQNLGVELSQKDRSLLTEQQKLQQLRQDIEALKQSMSLELSRKDGEISQLRDTTTTIQLGSDVVFALGSTRLSTSGRAVLLEVTELIENYPDYLVSLEGHTDNIPIKAERQAMFPSNWELSAARASAAARFLVAQGVDSHRLRVVGYGPNRAIADNSSESGRAQNRRLEIRFSPKPRIRLAQ